MLLLSDWNDANNIVLIQSRLLVKFRDLINQDKDEVFIVEVPS